MKVQISNLPGNLCFLLPHPEKAGCLVCVAVTLCLPAFTKTNTREEVAVSEGTRVPDVHGVTATLHRASARQACPTPHHLRPPPSSTPPGSLLPAYLSSVRCVNCSCPWPGHWFWGWRWAHRLTWLGVASSLGLSQWFSGGQSLYRAHSACNPVQNVKHPREINTRIATLRIQGSM